MTIPSRYLEEPCTIRRDATVVEAAAAMRAERIGSLVVVDGDGRPVGVVTDRDVALGVLGGEDEVDPATAKVESCMSDPIITASSESSLLDCARMMRKHVVRRLPIVNRSGELVGILTADDLMIRFAEDLRWVAQAAKTGFANEETPPERTGSVFGKE